MGGRVWESWGKKREGEEEEEYHRNQAWTVLLPDLRGQAGNMHANPCRREQEYPLSPPTGFSGRHQSKKRGK
ncbi:hypothetical protein RRG08_025088 [Elysia crispata]|uniref:Uncharacterized protein n=1 Tax=Elysia crispata TaxID=231223 RepID=A0AAE1AJG7_9GAST|nr:hypothetical protein RRG08_025088 [Elysia crispata]